jgi:hypothetical protein
MKVFEHMPKNFRMLEATPEGRELELTPEMERDLHVVYKWDDDHKGGYFAGLYNPETTYSDDYFIAPLRSVYGGLSPVYQIGTTFANIIGSSRPNADPFPSNYKTWIKLIEDALGETAASSCCAEKDKIHKSPGITSSDEFSCGGVIVGGHVALNVTSAQKPVEDGSATVYLLPICNCHNTHQMTPSKGVGIGYYMQLSIATKAVILNRYKKS